jgi:DNA replicative helicase MCM subunit Mcm2 (Cdc46/Mcm family)
MTAHQQHPNEDSTDGNVGNGNDVIELIPTEELQGEQIVTVWFCSFKSKQMTIKFNDRYHNKLIDSIPIDLEDIGKMLDGLRDTLAFNNIANEHINSLENTLILNNPRITEFFARKTEEQITEGQRSKKERIDNLKNTPHVELSLKHALQRKSGNVSVKGMFVGGSVKVERMYNRIGFWCGECGELNILADYSDRPMLHSEIPKKLRQKCQFGCQGTFTNEPYYDYVTALCVEFRDTETTNDPPTTDVILFNKYTMDVLWNEPVRITGSIQHVSIKGKVLPHIFVGLRSEDEKAIDPINEIDIIEITDKDEIDIQIFADQNRGNILEAIAEMHKPSHIGDIDAKKGIILCAANTGTNPKLRINVLFLGETGLDKTPLAHDAIYNVQGSKFAIATDSTANSLICVVDGETGHFRFGPVVTSHGAICVIDEIGRMLPEEQARLLSAMGPEGKVGFIRYGIPKDLDAVAGFILTANPNTVSGRFTPRPNGKIDPTDFPFIGPFRDRVDLVFIFRTDRREEHLRDYASNKFATKNLRQHIELQQREGRNYQFIKKFIQYNKQFEPSEYSLDTQQFINDYFVKVMTPLDSQASNRLHDTLCKLCYANARLEGRNTIELEDAVKVTDIYNNQLNSWSQIEIVPPDPYDDAYQKMVNKLKDKTTKSPTNGFTFTEILQNVCEEDDIVDTFTQKINRIGERDWSIEGNAKIHRLHDRFNGKDKKYPRDERVLILNKSPLTLAWRDVYTKIDEYTNETDQTDQTDPGNAPNKTNIDGSSSTDNNTSKANNDSKISNEGIEPISSISLPSNTPSDVESKSNKSNSPTTITGDIASDKSINDFFSNGNGIPSNSLQQSPCYPIIGSRSDEIHGSVDDVDGNPIDASYTNTIYYCKLHPDVENVFLGEIELHCREKEPEIHKAEVLKALGLGG